MRISDWSSDVCSSDLDLYYIRNRARAKGDRSVSLFSAALGTALDIKPVLRGYRGDTGPVAKVKGFDAATQQMFEFAARRVDAGLLTPTVAVCYRSEEHTSELQSLTRNSFAVFCLNKKKNHISSEINRSITN